MTNLRCSGEESENGSEKCFSDSKCAHSAQEPAQNEESHTWKSLSCAATLVPDLILPKTTGHLMSVQQQRPVVLWKILEWHGSLAASAQLEESSISSCHCGVVHRSGLPTCSRVPPTPNGQKQLNSQRVATEATSRGLCVLHCWARCGLSAGPNHDLWGVAAVEFGEQQRSVAFAKHGRPISIFVQAGVGPTASSSNEAKVWHHDGHKGYKQDHAKKSEEHSAASSQSAWRVVRRGRGDAWQ